MAAATSVPAQTGTFPDIIQFQGEYRPSQRRAIDTVLAHFEDHAKACVVAPPGSGRSFIGLGIMQAMDVPTLIISGTSALAEQWKTRFEEGFLPEGEDVKKWVSRDASVKAPVISVTFQALHSSLNVKKPIDRWMKNAGVQFVILDDPAHLRVEYWKVVETLQSSLPGCVFLSLFSSDPIDVTAQEQSKIADYCGSSFVTVSTADLLTEGTFVPYQDYVLQCLPEGENVEKLAHYEELRAYYADYFRKDEGFASILQANLNLENLKEFSDAFREHPDYFMTLMAFLKSHKMPLPDPMPKLLGPDPVLPELDDEAMKLLLSGYLDFDKEAYNGTEEYRTALTGVLQDAGLLHKGKLNFDHEEETAKLLSAGEEKFAVLERLIRREFEKLGKEMRMLILTEGIKKELSSCIGDETKPIREMGAVTLFESLRRAKIDGLRMGVITSTFMAVPKDVLPVIEPLVKFTQRDIKLEDYVQLQFATNIVKDGIEIIQELMEEGFLNCIISVHTMAAENLITGSFNSMVLAEKPGNAAVAAQLRGLALKKDPDHADKTMQIWHLVMVDNHGTSEEKDAFLKQNRSFTGITYDTNRLAYGAERLGCLSLSGSAREEFLLAMKAGEEAAVKETGEAGKTEKAGGEDVWAKAQDLWKPVKKVKRQSRGDVEALNLGMLDASENRHALWKEWNLAVKQSGGRGPAKYAEAVEYSQKVFPKTAYEKEIDKRLMLSAGGIVLLLIEFFGTGLLRGLVGTWVAALLYGIAAFGLGMLFFQNIQGRRTRFTPRERILRMAQTVLEALQDHGVLLDDTVEIVHEELSEGHMRFWLKGGSAEEQEAFADTLAEAFGPVTTQLCVVEERTQDGNITYYPSPAIFNDELGENNDFYRNLDTYFGGVIMGYTAGKLGRELMLNSRFWSMANPLGKSVKRARIPMGV